MTLTKNQIVRLYRHLAPVYDAVVIPLYWLFFARQRRRAINGLGLQPGQCVLDICCGTGLSFHLLHAAVGPTGRIIGVDLAPAMLARAGRRARRAGYHNVELVQIDVGALEVPAGVDAAISTFGLEIVPEYDDVVRRVSAALPDDGRMATCGLKHPERWPRWLIDLSIWASSPFGVSRDYEAFRPYRSIDRYFQHAECTEYYAGAAYVSVGRAPTRGE